MTLTVEIPDETIDQVRAAAAANGMDVETFTVRAAITTAGAFAIADDTGEGHRDWDDNVWWRDLSDQERAAEIEALRVSLAAADAGRVRTAEHVFALMGAKG